MEHPKAICTLKVKINCCTMCQLKAKDKLQKCNGVESVVCDSKGVVTMSGKVNPMTIVKKVEKWGKKAELLSFQQSPNQEVQATGIDDDFDHGSHPKINKDCCCHCDAISDSDSDNHDHRHDCKVLGSKKSNPNITLRNPDLTMNKQSTKSKAKKGFFGLFCKKGGEAKKKLDGATMLGKPPMVDGPPKWQFPRIPMPEYGGPSPRPNYQPFEPYHPQFMGRPSAPPYHPFGLMRPPPPPPLVPPPPYGFFNSRPPPKVNPMIHYTSYADNYSHW